MNAKYCLCFALYGLSKTHASRWRPDKVLIACLGDLIVLGWIRFAGNAREAGVASFRRTDHPDRRPTTASGAGLVGRERRLEPRSYLFRGLNTVVLQVYANIFAESDRHET